MQTYYMQDDALRPQEIDLTPRAIFLFERLERRLLLTIVPIDATAGLPFDGLVATELRLPAYATGLDHLDVIINGQYAYDPIAVAKADGTFDLYARMTPQTAGTAETAISFRNDITGGWDVLESGEQTVKPNHFSAAVPDTYIHDRVVGTQFHDRLTTFTTSPLTQALEDYVVDINWFGQSKTGRLVQQSDGTVATYVNDAYIPIGGGGDAPVTATVRLAGAPADAPPVGYAQVNVSAYPEIGFGMFYGSKTSETDFSIYLPKNPTYNENVGYHYFNPASELEGWTSTFTVEVLWQDQNGDLGSTSGTVVRNPDGSHAVIGTWPARFATLDGMIKIRETVERPAVDGQPAQTYTVGYVGSFTLAPQGGEENPTPETPIFENPPNEIPDLENPSTVVGPSQGEPDLEASLSDLPSSEPVTGIEPRMDSLASDFFSGPDDPLLGDLDGEEDDADVTTLVG